MNRVPTYYAKFYSKKGKLESNNHSNTDNNGVAVYDNGDGTFTIDVRDDAKMKHDSRMFANSDSVDLTRPNEVVRKPIAHRNEKGNLEIIEKGELVNTDTIEYQEQQAQQEQQGGEQISDNIVTDNTGVSEQTQQEQVTTQPNNNEQVVTDNSQSEPNILSTGEVEEQVEQPSQTTSEELPFFQSITDWYFIQRKKLLIKNYLFFKDRENTSLEITSLATQQN